MDEAITTSTLTEWIVIIVCLVLMVTFFKDLVLNFGQSYPAFSTVFVAVVFGSLWWFLIVKGPRAEAQTQPKPTPAIQQSIGSVSGGSTVNQAGGNITINQGITEETLKRLLDQRSVADRDQLTAKYPKGYVLLGAADGKIVFNSNQAPANVRIDWTSTELSLDKNKGTITLNIPDIETPMGNIRGCSISHIPFAALANMNLVAIGNDRLRVEVLDPAKGIVVVGLKPK